MELQYIPLTVNEIEKVSDRFDITLAGVELIFEAAWNGEEEALFISCYDSKGSPILEGRLLIHGENLFEGIMDERLPAVRIIPLDLTGVAETTGITLENIKDETVKLYLFEVV